MSGKPTRWTVGNALGIRDKRRQTLQLEVEDGILFTIVSPEDHHRQPSIGLARGLGSLELAERAGVSRQTVVRIEAGAKGVAFDAVERVRTALEKAGAVFLPSAAEHGPGVARRKANRQATEPPAAVRANGPVRAIRLKQKAYLARLGIQLPSASRRLLTKG